MLRQIKLDRLWLGHISYVNATAVGGTWEGQRIHRPPTDATARRWYCLTSGLEVGIFTSWYVHPSCIYFPSSHAHPL